MEKVDAIGKRLARIEGQVGGVRRMVADDAYCIDILTQVSAIRSALDQVAALITVRHVDRCILDHGHDAHSAAREKSREELVAELQDVLSRLMK